MPLSKIPPSTSTPNTRVLLYQLLRLANTRHLLAFVLSSGITLVAPLATAFFVGLLASQLINKDTNFHKILATLFALCVSMVISRIGDSLITNVRSSLTHAIDGKIRQAVRKLATDEMKPWEANSKDAAEDFRLVLDGWSTHTGGAAAVAQLGLAVRWCAAISATLILTTFSIYIGLLAFVGCSTIHLILRRQWSGSSGIRALAVNTKPLQKKSAQVGKILTSPTSAREVRIFNLSNYLLCEHERISLQRLNPIWDKRAHILRQQWAVVLIAIITAVLPLVWMTREVANGAISLSMFFFYIRVFVLLFNTSSLGIDPFIVENGSVAARAFIRLQKTDSFTTHSIINPQISLPHPPKIELQNVEFAYDPNKPPVLRGINLTISPGEKIAIVGLNGVGKSTLIRLIAGLEHAQAGDIKFAGISINNMDEKQLHKKLAVLLQDTAYLPLLHHQNISLYQYGREPLNGEALAKAISTAAANFVNNETTACEDQALQQPNLQLSGGQKQKLSLARTLYAAKQGAEIILLDEPTSHLDTEAEDAIYKKMMEDLASKTVLLVTHRLPLARHVDRVIVLSEGKIAEEGTHDELIERGGEYSNWYQLQSNLLQGERG